MLFDRVKISTTTVGIADFILGAALPGYQTYAAAGATNGQTVRYIVIDNENWEIGEGTYNGLTVTRAIIHGSSNSGDKIALSGEATLFSGLTVQDINSKSNVGHVHTKAEISDFAEADYATAAQGELASTALQPANLIDYALESYVDNAVSALVDTAPDALDTLNELAAALGDDSNFATTITNQIGTKLNSSAYTAADVLAKINTVDGTGSLLDADFLDGQHASAFATAAQGARADSALQPSDLVTSVRTIWVDPAGDDQNAGDVPTSPVQSISAAVELAEPGDIIRVRSGVYVEAYPIVLPRDVSVFGDGLRNVEVRPTEATSTNNAWLVDSGAYLWGMTFAKHQSGSFAVAFNDAADNASLGASGLGAFILKSPYIQNCSSYTAAQDGGLAGSTSVGETGGGMEIDGAKCAPNSPIRSMVVDSYTQVNLNGPGALVKNDAYAQLVSFFGTFCSYHVKAETGGQVNLSNSTTNFGTFGLVADGRSATAVFTGTAAAATTGVNTITVDSMSASRIGPSSRPVAGMVFDVAGNTYTVTGAIPNGTGWDTNFFPVLDGALSGGETVEFFQRSQISTGGHVMEYVGAGTNYNALPWYGGVPIPANEIVQVGDGRVFFSSTDQLGNFRVGSQFDVNGTTGAVTINTDDFNLSGLNAIGPFSRDGIEAVGVQLQEVSNNVDLLASTGVADGNTTPTQFAVKSYLEARYTLTDDLAVVATSGAYGDLSDLPTLGTAAATDAVSYATASQGALADSAIQLGDLAPYALETYVDSAIATLVDTAPATLDTLNELAAALGDDPNFATSVSNQIGTKLNASAYTAADVLAKMVTVDGAGSGLDADLLDGQQATAFATAAQGLLADSATQPSDLATVATTGAYGDLSGLPTLGTAAATDATAYATAAQGALANSATQPGDLATVATSGAYSDLSGAPSLVTSLNGLSDVNLTNVANQDRLRFDGTAFVNEDAVIRLNLGNTSGSQAINLDLAEMFSATATGAVTWNFSNARGNGAGFVLILTDGGDFAQTWPASVQWPAATAPTLTSGGVDVLVFITDDGGTTWRGALAIGAAA